MLIAIFSNENIEVKNKKKIVFLPKGYEKILNKRVEKFNVNKLSILLNLKIISFH